MAAVHASQIDIWALGTGQLRAIEHQFGWSILSPSELAKATRVKLPAKRSQFVATRTALRCILARYLSVHPAEIALEYGTLGKPFVASLECAALKFSLSHSAGHAVLAVTRAFEIGVDLERIRNKDLVDVVIQRWLGLGARQKIAPSRDYATLFFMAWCAQEAYLKELGVGLSTGMTQYLHPLLDQLADANDANRELLKLGGSCIHLHRVWPGFVLATSYSPAPAEPRPIMRVLNPEAELLRDDLWGMWERRMLVDDVD